MKDAIVSVFKWIKGLIFLILSLPFLLIGAIGAAVAVLAILVGLIGLFLLFLAGIVKIDGKGIKQAIEEATKAAR